MARVDDFTESCTGCIHVATHKSSWTNSSYEVGRYSPKQRRVDFEVEYVTGMCTCKDSKNYGKEVYNTRFHTRAESCKLKELKELKRNDD